MTNDNITWITVFLFFSPVFHDLTMLGEPVTVLKEYQDNFIRARPLDVEREDTPCEGKLIEIFVLRMKILKDEMADFRTGPPILDLSFALNITFIAKEGADYGGPSKEFLGAVMRELCDQLFDEAGSEEYIYTNIILEQG